jgi:hypothetical protein
MQQGDEQRSDNPDKGDEERPSLLVVLTAPIPPYTPVSTLAFARCVEPR